MKTDIFNLLAEGATTNHLDSGLPTISLWRSAIHYLMFFTLFPERFASHYDDEKKVTYLCLGDDCPACGVGDRVTEHVYLPVWDAANRRVAVLRFDTRLDGPARKILGFLEAYRDQLSNVIAVVDCNGKGKGEFTITAHKPLPETDRGALACKAFCDDLESGVVNLKSCVRRLDSEEIAALPSIRRKAVRIVGEPVAPGGPPAPAPVTVGEPVRPTDGGGA